MAVLSKYNKKEKKNAFLFCTKLSVCYFLFWVQNCANSSEYDGNSNNVMIYNHGKISNIRVMRSLGETKKNSKSKEEDIVKKLKRDRLESSFLPKAFHDIYDVDKTSASGAPRFPEWYKNNFKFDEETIEKLFNSHRKGAMEGDPECLAKYPKGYWDPYFALYGKGSKSTNKQEQAEQQQEQQQELYKYMLKNNFKDVPDIENVDADIKKGQPHVVRSYGQIDNSTDTSITSAAATAPSASASAVDSAAETADATKTQEQKKKKKKKFFFFKN
ncbi:hypothetical protein MKS88_005245 [Plasmodium brasilianum]|uniref:Uncharacterized protein n=2 Tax=Plasmodium (Plasmodium) TaxID=418103 RepID=A0A1A8WLS5_PLAMA|nr:Plasmodium exported protein, unknown function [Plasmodium malariae]KAI4834571.1 hypothetical protein MKS88_005245 [Plasmodium brasilianum]SBS93159.1 Plasmodium exported protein, unknown function [Plasmodium malariae]SCP03109.1 Plasmodium exported protein, unknown function [Plasmodium malariae]